MPVHQHHTRRASTIRTCGSSAPTTSRATTARRAARPATSVYANDRDPRHSRPVRAVRPRRRERRPPIRRSRRTSRPPAQARVHARDPVVAVHGLPHAPAEHVHEHLLRLHDVGLRVRRAVMWPEKQQYPTDAESARDPRPQSRRRRRSAASGAIREFLKNVSTLNPQLKDTQFADYHGHGWNFRAVFKRDRKGNLLDKDGKRGRRRRSGEIQEGRAPVVDPRRRRHALRRLPLRAGRPRQRPHLRRGRRGGRDRLRGLPRHGDALPDAAAPPGPRRGPAARDLVAAAHAGRPQALRVARRQALSSARRSTRTREWEMSLVKDTREPGPSRTTTRRPRARS